MLNNRAPKKGQIPDTPIELTCQLIRKRGEQQALFDNGGLPGMIKKRLIEKALEQVLFPE